MNPARHDQWRAEARQTDEVELVGVEPAESRSWEPPCWPSDGWDIPTTFRKRAIGWRGSRAH